MPGRKPKVSDKDLLERFQNTPDPVLSTAEVAEELPIKRRATLNRLQSLKDRNLLESKQIGMRNTVWWLSFDAGARKATDSMRGGRDTSQQEGTKTPSQSPPKSNRSQSHESGKEGDMRRQARERIDELDLAGSGTGYERRSDAVLKMYDHLRNNPGERKSKSDFADLLDSVDVGYSGGFESLWSNWVKGSGDRPNALDALPGVELRGEDYVFER